MNLNEYIKKLQRIVEKNPDTGKLPVVYGKDDEGNEFGKVTYDPAPGTLEEGSFTAHTQEPNAVCLN